MVDAFGTYDDANKMTQISGSSFSPVPDADGNQRQIKSNGYPFTSTTLTYDSRNKLVTADTGTPEWAYRYDGFGRRVYRQNHITTPTSRRHYIYAGDILIGELDDGVPTVAYTWGPDGVASRRLLTGTPSSRFYCYGPQGETRNLTDEFQTVTSTYFYEAYGKPLGTSPTEYNPYRYGGKFGYYTDNEIQTLQVGARWYSPYLIRWMSRDPIHYRGGDNLSAYVMGNPVKYVDPSGLEPNVNYSSLDEAGGQALLDAQMPTIQHGFEYGGMICKPWFRSCYYYTPPRTDKSVSQVLFGECGLFSTDAATFHTHGNSRKPTFSRHDKSEAGKGKIPWFLIGRDNKRQKLLPNGTIIFLDETP